MISSLNPFFLVELLVLALPCILLLVLTVLFAWRYRNTVASDMNQRGAALSALAASPRGLEEPDLARQGLALCQVEGQAPLNVLDGDKRAQAWRAGLRVRWIFAIAGGIQMLFTAGAVYWLHSGVPGLSMVYPPLLTAYLSMLPGLVLLAAFVMRRTSSRVALFAAYLAAGFVVIVLGPDHILANGPHVIASTLEISLQVSALPLLGVGLLLARRLRPFLLVWAACGFFELSGTLLFGILYGREMADMSLHDLTPFAVGLGLANFCLGAAFLFWLLRQREKFRAIALLITFVVVAWAVEHWLFPKLPVGQIATGTVGNALQFYMLWLVFQGLIRLEEQNFLRSEILHFDLCWLFLALCASQRFISEETFVTPHLSLAISLGFFLGLAPFAGYAIFLHVALRRDWIAQRHWPGRRLLLLRVFGGAAKRARLFDMLGETWRHVGRIDFIAGTDLSQRHVDARALEAFLLGRLHALFLKSPAEVDQRVAALRTRLEGDLRYPVNELYCYADAWQYAVQRLAADSDAVIMDLRGFTSGNRGCAFELGVLVQFVPLERILLLTDSTTDGSALMATIQSAWLAAPAGSANVHLGNPKLILISFTGKTKRDQDILESWLFSAVFGATTSVVGRSEFSVS
jgi:hypothetical protein